MRRKSVGQVAWNWVGQSYWNYPGRGPVSSQLQYFRAPITIERSQPVLQGVALTPFRRKRRGLAISSGSQSPSRQVGLPSVGGPFQSVHGPVEPTPAMNRIYQGKVREAERPSPPRFPSVQDFLNNVYSWPEAEIEKGQLRDFAPSSVSAA